MVYTPLYIFYLKNLSFVPVLTNTMQIRKLIKMYHNGGTVKKISHLGTKYNVYCT